MLITQLCLTLCYAMDCSLPGSSIHGISQARTLECVAISFSRDLPDPGIEPVFSAWQGGFFTTEPPGRPRWLYSLFNSYLKVPILLPNNCGEESTHRKSSLFVSFSQKVCSACFHSQYFCENYNQKSIDLTNQERTGYQRRSH